MTSILPKTQHAWGKKRLEMKRQIRLYHVLYLFTCLLKNFYKVPIICRIHAKL